MNRPSRILPALAIAALLIAAPLTASPTAEAKSDPAVSLKFTPTASNGMHAHVEAIQDEVTLEFTRKGRSVSYVVPAEITEAGLKAKFGKLGEIDVAFRPTKTLNVREPPKRCKGEPSISRKGLFVGTIEFTGERGFVRMETTSVEGKLFEGREQEWRCTDPKRPRGRERAEPEKDRAALYVTGRRCRCLFLAITEPEFTRRGQSVFLGGTQEDREGMKIDRETRAQGRLSNFAFDLAAGTASVNPPFPFTGSGTFKRRPRGRDLWRSTIRVPLLGAAPLEVRGRALRVLLVGGPPSD